MSKYLFLFTIGPVQSFISQARKTHDLWAGSQILSELIKTAIDEIGRENVIFPFSYSKDDKKWKDEIKSLPNRLVAKIEVDEKKLLDLGQRVEKAVRKKWNDIAEKTITNSFLLSKKCTINFGDCKEQLDFHLDIHWLFEELVASDYSVSFERLEQKMGGIKNIRPFTQYNNQNGERGRKCSLDGFRNIKFYRKSKNQHDKKESDADIKSKFLFANDNCILQYDDKGIDRIGTGEGLSSVSFVKRFYKYNNKKSREEFESTSEIALLRWIQYLEHYHNDKLQEYKKGFSSFNEQLFFKENLQNQDYCKKQGIQILSSTASEDLDFLVKLAKNGGYEQSKYFAVLMFDGDSMGEWLSYAKTEKEHSDFSKLLIDFGLEAKAYIDDGRGKTVYAGGDDFLGFITLECLFEVLIWLRDNFKSKVADKVSISNPNKEKFTISAGVCIAHYKEPLGLVLGKTRAMEKKAKDWRKEKNAFAVSVIKGSGEEHEMVWGFENNSLENISYLVDLLRSEIVSNTFIKNFQIEFERALDNKKTISPFHWSLLEIELLRLIQRSIQPEYSKKKDELSKELIQKIWDELFKKHKGTEGVILKNFFTMLDVCNFLNRVLPSLKQKMKQYVNQ